MKNRSTSWGLSSTLKFSAAAFCLFLAACGKHNTDSNSQLAAKVGSYEITRYQVDASASGLPNLPPKDLTAAKGQIVRHLVDRQLLVQRAQALKLDRTPQVLMAIEASRQDILAKAYVRQIVDSLPQPTDREIRKYYEDHTELFSARKLYSLKEIRVQSADAAEVAAVVAIGTSSKSIDDVSQLLHEKGIKFSSENATRAPETLPLRVLPTFAQAKDGAVTALQIPGGAYVAQIVSTKAAAVDEEVAAPNIRRFLVSQREQKTVSDELGQLRKSQKVQYFGEFQQSTSELDASTGGTTSDTSAKAPMTGEEQRP